jgi:hypothetical protein
MSVPQRKDSSTNTFPEPKATSIVGHTRATLLDGDIAQITLASGDQGSNYDFGDIFIVG